MKFKIQKSQLPLSLPETLRRFGYSQQIHSQSGEVNYVRRLSNRNSYPRFHLYLKEAEAEFELNLHLDQKKPSYPGAKAHSAEYDEPIVQEEVSRILSLIN